MGVSFYTNLDGTAKQTREFFFLLHFTYHFMYFNAFTCWNFWGSLHWSVLYRLCRSWPPFNSENRLALRAVPMEFVITSASQVGKICDLYIWVRIFAIVMGFVSTPITTLLSITIATNTHARPIPSVHCRWPLANFFNSPLRLCLVRVRRVGIP